MDTSEVLSIEKVLQNRNVGAEYDSKLQFGKAKLLLHTGNQIHDSSYRSSKLLIVMNKQVHFSNF